MTPTEIWLEEVHWKQMLADVHARAPIEACGLVAGEDHHSREVFSIENIEQSPVRFLMDPRDQLRVFEVLDTQDWDLLAIYHSHPSGPNHPSITDLKEAAYPEAVNLIWSKMEDDWQCRGFLINGFEFQEIQIHLIQNP